MINYLFTFISNLRAYNSYLVVIVVLIISYLICGIISVFILSLNALTFFPEIIEKNSSKVPLGINIIISSITYFIVIIIGTIPMILLWATPTGLKRTADNFVSFALHVSVALLFIYKKVLYLFKRRV